MDKFVDKNKVIEMPKERGSYVMLDDKNEVKGILYHPPKRYFPKEARYVIAFQEGFNWLSDQNLTGQEWKILSKLIAQLDFNNYWRVSQKELAEQTGIAKSHISEALKKFCEMDIIFPGPMAGRSKTYRLSPWLGHKGAKGYKETVVDFEKIRDEKQKKVEEANIELARAIAAMKKSEDARNGNKQEK